MLHRRITALLAAVVGALALSATACSSLTRPDEIVISAEPAGVRPAPAPAPAPMPAAPSNLGPAGAQQGG